MFVKQVLFYLANQFSFCFSVSIACSSNIVSVPCPIFTEYLPGSGVRVTCTWLDLLLYTYSMEDIP